jgi:aspartate/methionine/tyrosine aminotransferase
MRIDPITYMEWAKNRPEARINLSLSGWADLSWKDLALGRKSLDINGEHPYGYAPLVEALVSRYDVSEDSVVTTNGASQAVFFTCAALIEPGDEVLVEKPAYEPLLAVPRFFRARIRRLERRFEEGYAIDPDTLRAAISPRTKLVILTNLHNPSGALLSRRAVKELALAAAARGVMILVDEIYLEFAEGKKGTTSFSLSENIIVASSLTKVYGLGGLRCGWLLAPAPLAAKVKRLLDYVSVEGVFIGEQISARVFSRLDAIRVRNAPMIKRNLGVVRDFVRGEERLRWVEPAHGIICFPRIEASLDGDELLRLLLEKYGTSVVPGRFFEARKHFRLGFGLSTPWLKRGLRNIGKALEAY